MLEVILNIKVLPVQPHILEEEVVVLDIHLVVSLNMEYLKIKEQVAMDMLIMLEINGNFIFLKYKAYMVWGQH